MIANARMYAVTDAVGELWRALLAALIERSGVPLTLIEHAAPAPMHALWSRADLGAVFICGLPYSRAAARPHLVAAPLPAQDEFHGLPQYWSELVVRTAGDCRSVDDTFGRRVAFTAPDSQSGYAAALTYFMAAPGPRPLFREVIAPQITPLGAMLAVIGGAAELAPIDAYAFRLLQRYRPDLTEQLRVVGRTKPTAIPPLVSSGPVPRSLEAAFLTAHEDRPTRELLGRLLLDRFVRPEPAAYDALRSQFDASTRYWREHPLAAVTHPAFKC